MKLKIFVLACILATVVFFWPTEPEVVVEETPQDDTGLSRDKTEDLMRTIGYVQ